MRVRSFVVLRQRCIRDAERAVGGIVARVILNPLLIGLGRLVEFAGHEAIVVGRDGKFFPFAGMRTELEGLALILAGASQFSQAGIAVGQSPVGSGKFRVEFDGALIVGDRLRRALLHAGAGSQGKRLQGLKRRGSCLAERDIEFLYRGQRLA